MKKMIKLCLLIAAGLLLSLKGECAGSGLTKEFRDHLNILKTYAIRADIDSLRIDDREGFSTKEETALWGIQRGIERLLEEHQSFETVKDVVKALKEFGEEVKDNAAFWTEALNVYSNKVIPVYEEENHWQTWFKAHLCSEFGTRGDILGCLLYPVRYTAIHCNNEWMYDPFVFYLQAYSADYGNAYARVKVREFVGKRKIDEEEDIKEALDLSMAIALHSPFNKFFSLESDINKFLYAAFADSCCKDDHFPTSHNKWQQERKILESMSSHTGESLYYLAHYMWHMGEEDGAVRIFGESISRGFEESKVYLSGIRPGSLRSFVQPQAKFFELTLEEEIIYSVYRDIFGLEI